MAKQQAAWGIDIGQCALKALRCVWTGESVEATSFDYIEYPKSLSQPDAKPEEIIREALEQFLSRNKVRGDKVAISVSGQAGLARFFRPPATEPKLLPSIVKYEAKQQIPFQIDEVVWDWQQIGGFVEDNQLVDAEVGLFAMKRDAVYRAMQPFLDAGVEVDFVQLSPIATYNMICYELLGELPDPAEVDPENPPPYTLVISVGTESTDVVVTNGIRLWLRNIAIGGNHFTKQLSREMKLTHAKAEHLKLNARQAEDPKALFQAMRPVFADLSDELSRSLNYFRSIDRNAEIGKTYVLGNASKLPGLRQYLEQQLEVKIERLDSFKKVTGQDVVAQKAFAQNVPSFAPCYGLCVQSLDRSELTTNLLPQEFVVEKIVRSKKPWLLGTVAMVMMGLAVQHAMGSLYEYRTSNDFSDGSFTWQAVKSKAKNVRSQSSAAKTKDDELNQELKYVNALGEDLVSASTARTQMLTMLSAMSQVVPKDPRADDLQVDIESLPFEDREEVFLDGLSETYSEDLSKWFTEDHKTKFAEYVRELNKHLGIAVDEKAATAAGGTATKDPTEPKGAGWVITLSGHHYVTSTDRREKGLPTDQEFLTLSYFNNLLNKEVTINGQNFLLQDLGMVKPTVIAESHKMTTVPGVKEEKVEEVDTSTPNSGSGADMMKQRQSQMNSYMSQAGSSGGGSSEGAEITDGVDVQRFNFVIELGWMPVSFDEAVERRDARLQALAEAEEKAAAEAAAAEPNAQQ